MFLYSEKGAFNFTIFCCIGYTERVKFTGLIIIIMIHEFLLLLVQLFNQYGSGFISFFLIIYNKNIKLYVGLP